MSKLNILLKGKYVLVKKYLGDKNKIVGGKVVLLNKDGVEYNLDKETLIAMARAGMIRNVYYISLSGNNGTFRTIDDVKIESLRVDKNDIDIKKADNIDKIINKKEKYELTVENVVKVVRKYNYKLNNKILAEDLFNCTAKELTEYRVKNNITDSDLKLGVNEIKELPGIDDNVDEGCKHKCKGDGECKEECHCAKSELPKEIKDFFEVVRKGIKVDGPSVLNNQVDALLRDIEYLYKIGIESNK